MRVEQAGTPHGETGYAERRNTVRKIGSVAENALVRSKEFNRQPEAQDSESAIWVWQALTEMFGTPFLSSFGETPPTSWRLAISRLTNDQIKRGLTSLGNDARSFPPNLSEFVDACKRLPERRFNGVLPSPEAERLLLNKKRASPKVADRYLKEMRRAVRSATGYGKSKITSGNESE